MNNLTTNVIFVEHLQGVSSKTGKDYNMLKLSDGVDSKVFGCTILEDLNDVFTKGDSIEVTIKVDMFGFKTFQITNAEKL